MITVDEVTIEIGRIAELMYDYESAHGKEDALRERVLQAIAGGAPNAAELAREALRSSYLDFPRHCA